MTTSDVGATPSSALIMQRDSQPLQHLALRVRYWAGCMIAATGALLLAADGIRAIQVLGPQLSGALDDGLIAALATLLDILLALVPKR